MRGWKASEEYDWQSPDCLQQTIISNVDIKDFASGGLEGCEEYGR